MVSAQPTTYDDPLDLLHRFVPTPLRTRFRINGAAVLVETNDFSLLPVLPLDTNSNESIPSSFNWKLVRDLDVHGPLQKPLLLAPVNLTIVSMGAPCLVGVDHQRCELLCFIGADVDTRTFQDFLVPFLCRLTTKTGPQQQDVNGWKEDHAGF